MLKEKLSIERKKAVMITADFTAPTTESYPCYIMKEDDDWATCAYGENMEALGITHYMTRDGMQD